MTCQPEILLKSPSSICKLRTVSGDADIPVPMPKSVGNLRDIMQSNFKETMCSLIPVKPLYL
jgi:hypothetical protein